MTKPQSMKELLAKLPDTGITDGNQDDAEHVAAHPETWIPLFISSQQDAPPDIAKIISEHIHEIE